MKDKQYESEDSVRTWWIVTNSVQGSFTETHLLEFSHVFKRDRFRAVSLALHIIGAEPPPTLDVNFCVNTKRSAQQEVVQCKIEVAVKGEVDREWQ